MLGVNTLIQKLNTVIAGGSLTELQVVQLSKAIDTLENKGVSSVATVADLPNPVTNQGRFFWIESENRYTFSNGVAWNINNIIKPPLTNLFAWGSGSYGNLGDNTTVSKRSPVSVLGGFTDWIQVDVGGQHILGVRANGTLWAWGRQVNTGALGDNTAVDKSSPISVLGGFTDWIQASAGKSISNLGHSLGLRANGTLYSWGGGSSGRLGNNTVNINRSSPVLVSGGFTDWIQVSTGLDHSLGVRANGTLYAWGAGGAGRLGDNTAINRSSPVLVTGGFTDWIQASAGDAHSLGLQADGTLYAWGSNGNGQLGQNIATTVSRSSPALVIGGFTDWIQVDAGDAHSIGLRANGTLYAWGSNSSGQLGDGGTVSKSSPVLVSGGFTDWAQASAGTTFSLGVRANGTLWAWGNNGFGNLGDNSIFTRNSPISVIGGFTDWVQGFAGRQISLGIRG